MIENKFHFSVCGQRKGIQDLARLFLSLPANSTKKKQQSKSKKIYSPFFAKRFAGADCNLCKGKTKGGRMNCYACNKPAKKGHWVFIKGNVKAWFCMKHGAKER